MNTRVVFPSQAILRNRARLCAFALLICTNAFAHTPVQQSWGSYLWSWITAPFSWIRVPRVPLGTDEDKQFAEQLIQKSGEALVTSGKEISKELQEVLSSKEVRENIEKAITTGIDHAAAQVECIWNKTRLVPGYLMASLLLLGAANLWWRAYNAWLEEETRHDEYKQQSMKNRIKAGSLFFVIACALIHFNPTLASLLFGYKHDLITKPTGEANA